MPQHDPFLPLQNRQSMLFRGEKTALDRFLQQLDVGLPTGWIRDKDYERKRPRPDRTRSYLFDQPGDAFLRVWFEVVTPTRARACPVQLYRHPPQGQSARIGELVADFVNGHVLPVAVATGVLCSNPSFGPFSIVTLSAKQLLTQLADTADGEWPLNDETQVIWDDLIACCLAEQAGFDEKELTKWFTDSGWSPAASHSMTQKLYADATWLAKRMEAVARWSQ